MFPSRIEQSEDESNILLNSNCTQEHCEEHLQLTWEKIYHHTNILREEQNYFRNENITTDNLYRCLSCRNCNDCKSSSKLEAISLKDEREQALIEKSLSYDEENRTLYASLPFVHDPMEKLSCNRHIAKAIFESQMRQINKSPELNSFLPRALFFLFPWNFLSWVLWPGLTSSNWNFFSQTSC